MKLYTATAAINIQYTLYDFSALNKDYTHMIMGISLNSCFSKDPLVRINGHGQPRVDK
jgi:hypothetical protein